MNNKKMSIMDRADKLLDKMGNWMEKTTRESQLKMIQRKAEEGKRLTSEAKKSLKKFYGFN